MLPHRLQRSAASLAREVHHSNLCKEGRKIFGNRQGVVGARVVRNGDPKWISKLLAQVLVEAVDARAESHLFVVDGF